VNGGDASETLAKSPSIFKSWPEFAFQFVSPILIRGARYRQISHFWLFLRVVRNLLIPRVRQGTADFLPVERGGP
jgi:hypothetical protein